MSQLNGIVVNLIFISNTDTKFAENPKYFIFFFPFIQK